MGGGGRRRKGKEGRLCKGRLGAVHTGTGASVSVVWVKGEEGKGDGGEGGRKRLCFLVKQHLVGDSCFIMAWASETR